MAGKKEKNEVVFKVATTKKTEAILKEFVKWGDGAFKDTDDAASYFLQQGVFNTYLTMSGISTRRSGNVASVNNNKVDKTHKAKK